MNIEATEITLESPKNARMRTFFILGVVIRQDLDQKVDFIRCLPTHILIM